MLKKRVPHPFKLLLMVLCFSLPQRTGVGSGAFTRLLFGEGDASVPVMVNWDLQWGPGQPLPACYRLRAPFLLRAGL